MTTAIVRIARRCFLPAFAIGCLLLVIHVPAHPSIEEAYYQTVDVEGLAALHVDGAGLPDLALAPVMFNAVAEEIAVPAMASADRLAEHSVLRL
jgi:hypothetical protein